MLTKIKRSLSGINYKLFFALLVLGLAPTIYTTLRVFFLGQLPGEWAFSIAGQLSWVNLLYEIMKEGIILPLYFFVGRVLDDKAKVANRVRGGLLISLGIYSVLSLIVIAFAEPLLKLMATDASIIDASAKYIRIESVANIFDVLMQFALVALVAMSKDGYIYIFTGAKVVLSILCDTFLVSNLPISLNIGVYGIGYSNIIANAILLLFALLLLSKEGIRVFSRQRISFSWANDFLKVGGISGVESLVRNIAYMLMIARMVNMVGEQGTYWVANNFIWGWLLLPVLQLGELIKKEVAENSENVKKSSIGYFSVTALICALWFASIPLWEPFMRYVLAFDDTEKLMKLVLVLIGFYVVYAFQNVFDSIFYGLGKTNYMLFESIVTNTIYYGAAFILYLCGVWTPSLMGIALLFGIGNAFDGVVSLAAYVYLLKKEKISII